MRVQHHLDHAPTFAPMGRRFGIGRAEHMPLAPPFGAHNPTGVAWMSQLRPAMTEMHERNLCPLSRLG